MRPVWTIRNLLDLFVEDAYQIRLICQRVALALSEERVSGWQYRSRLFGALVIRRVTVAAEPIRAALCIVTIGELGGRGVARAALAADKYRCTIGQHVTTIVRRVSYRLIDDDLSAAKDGCCGHCPNEGSTNTHGNVKPPSSVCGFAVAAASSRPPVSANDHVGKNAPLAPHVGWRSPPCTSMA